VRPSSGRMDTRSGTPVAADRPTSALAGDAPAGTAPTGTPATGTGGRWLLETGGWLAAVMGAAHFVLPVIYPWELHVEGLYPPVRWALFATTVFFGVLLVFGGLLVVAVARSPDLPSGFATAIVGGMAAFWVLGTLYEVLVPFPDPAARWPLPIFSAALAVLHLGGLWLRGRDRSR
jgi:hypothetical protein